MACLRHDTLIYHECREPLATPFHADNHGTVGVWDAPLPLAAAQSRIVLAEAHLTMTKPAPAVPFSGPLGDLIDLTHRIDTQPTAEQWQTLKTIILRLDRTQNAR